MIPGAFRTNEDDLGKENEGSRSPSLALLRGTVEFR